MLHPAILLHVIQVDEPAGEGIAMGRSQDAAAAERKGGFGVEIVVVFGVEDAVGEGLAGTNAEEVAGETSTVRVDVIQGRAFLRRDARAHCALSRQEI